MTTSADVHAAAARIAGHIRVTPVIEADPGTFPPAARVWLKLEQLQHTGSFKARGALNRILSAAEQGMIPAAGVVAASGGNAGIAVAYAAARQNVPARVYVPAAVPAVKAALLQEYGAEVVRSGSRYAEGYEAAVKHAAEVGALFCHPYDQPEVCAGQGTLGLELLEQTGGELDTVLVAVGGGGGDPRGCAMERPPRLHHQRYLQGRHMLERRRAEQHQHQLGRDQQGRGNARRRRVGASLSLQSSSRLPWEEAFRLDLRYVDNWSLALDLQILWKTWSAVIHGHGAY
jgi:hypothetical protein